MRDPDAVMAYEARQQRVVDGIVSELHELTRDDDDYVTAFRKIACEILELLAAERLEDGVEYNARNSCILPPIFKLTEGQDNEVERKFLLLMVLDRILNSIRSRVTHDYLRRELEYEMRG